MQSKRQINFEMLRVLAMLLVILAHFLGWGTTHNIPNGEITFENGYILNSMAYPFLNSLASLGVICFVMISGYFMSTSNELRFDKILTTWTTTCFYSAICMILATLYYQHNIIDGINALLPIWSNQYWFVTKYIALLVMAPFLSLLVNTLSHKGMVYALLCSSLLTTTITHGFPYGNAIFSDNPFSLSTFIFIFLIAAYIRKYSLPDIVINNCGKLFFIIIILQGFGGIILNCIHTASDNIEGGFSSAYNALSIVPGTALFIWFKNHKFGDTFFLKAVV